MRVFPFFHLLAIRFSEIVIFMIYGNKTLCRPIRFVIILEINKSYCRCAVVRFCHYSYDYRPNWTPLSPVTITNNIKMLFRLTRALISVAVAPFRHFAISCFRHAGLCVFH